MSSYFQSCCRSNSSPEAQTGEATHQMKVGHHVASIKLVHCAARRRLNEGTLGVIMAVFPSSI